MKYELQMLMNTKMKVYEHQRFEELLVQNCTDFKNPTVSEPRKLAYPVDGETECIDYIYELDIPGGDKGRQYTVNIEAICLLYGDCLRYLLVKTDSDIK